MKRRKSGLLGVPAVALAMLLVAACGAEDDTAEVPVGDNVATGETLTIGVLVPSNGNLATPENEYGVKAAEWYVNNQLGGVDGRKLKLDICQGDGSPETAVACANDFVEKGYPVVVDGYDFSFGGARPILVEAGIPFAGTVSGDPTNETAEFGQGFYFSGPLAVTAGGMLNMWEAQGTKTANLVVVDAPSSHTYVDTALMPLSEAVGVELKIQYVDPSKSDYNAVAAASLEGDPDMAGSLSLPEDGCTSLFTALRQQGFDGDIYVGSCTQYVETMSPQDAAGTLVIPRMWLAESKPHAPEQVATELDDFTEAMNAVGFGDHLESRAMYGFGGVLTVAQAMSTIDGDINAETVTKALKAVDQQMFLGPKLKCDGQQWPGRPTSCTTQSIYFELQDDGTYAPGNEEGFVDLDMKLFGG
ncbi:ABC transporter substrate-binding protein [Nocardioides sp. LML1-1-1.1]|uniref:ABC transporter substrate-binding protein n=1 Tax=Nocardioides sp. LML1-1-1.1 TaxID=3135248 RepID=UPI00343CF5D2